VTEEVSIGDYVLSGGELPALVIIDAVSRYVPGVVGDERSVAEDSFSRGLLDFPQYKNASRRARGEPDGAGAAGTANVEALAVPEVLLSGNHAEIRRWRKREAISRTLTRRPDLLAGATLDEEERAYFENCRTEGMMGAIELVEKSQLTEKPAMKSGDTVRVHCEGSRGRQGTHPDFRRDRHRAASRRHPCVVHGA